MKSRRDVEIQQNRTTQHISYLLIERCQRTAIAHGRTRTPPIITNRHDAAVRASQRDIRILHGLHRVAIDDAVEREPRSQCRCTARVVVRGDADTGADAATKEKYHTKYEAKEADCLIEGSHHG